MPHLKKQRKEKIHRCQTSSEHYTFIRSADRSGKKDGDCIICAVSLLLHMWCHMVHWGSENAAMKKSQMNLSLKEHFAFITVNFHNPPSFPSHIGIVKKWYLFFAVMQTAAECHFRLAGWKWKVRVPVVGHDYFVRMNQILPLCIVRQIHKQEWTNTLNRKR